MTLDIGRCAGCDMPHDSLSYHDGGWWCYDEDGNDCPSFPARRREMWLRVPQAVADDPAAWSDMWDWFLEGEGLRRAGEPHLERMEEHPAFGGQVYYVVLGEAAP